MDSKATNWIFKKSSIREIGTIANDKYQFADIDLSKDFEMIIFLRKTSSSKCFAISKKK